METVKEVHDQARTRMDKAVADFQHELSTLRTGRASINLLDNIRVDYYGTPTPLNQLANLHVPEPGMITVQPWDVSQIGPIEKVIRTSDLGINPANDGKVIRLPIPPLNEERRKELVKKLTKDKKVAEDEERRALDDMQKMTDAQMAKIDQFARSKEKDLLEIK